MMSDDPYNPSPIGNPSVLARRNWWQTRLVIFIGKITPKCPEVTRLLSQGMDRPLPLRTRLSIRLHYLICCWCQRYGEHLQFLRKIACQCDQHAETVSNEELSEQARKKIRQALKDELEKSGPS